MNFTETSAGMILTFTDVQPALSAGDDEVEIYIEDDDVEYDLAGIPTVGVIMIVIFSSMILCGVIFCLSFGNEKKYCSRGARKRNRKRLAHDIENELRLRHWDSNDMGYFQDDMTDEENSNSECDGRAFDISSNISDVPVKDELFNLMEQKHRCVLCSKNFKEEDIISESTDPMCKHIFHKDCIISWLQKNSGCPCCRRSYIGEPVEVSVNDESSCQASQSCTNEDVAFVGIKKSIDSPCKDIEPESVNYITTSTSRYRSDIESKESGPNAMDDFYNDLENETIATGEIFDISEHSGIVTYRPACQSACMLNSMVESHPSENNDEASLDKSQRGMKDVTIIL